MQTPALDPNGCRWLILRDRTRRESHPRRSSRGHRCEIPSTRRVSAFVRQARLSPIEFRAETEFFNPAFDVGEVEPWSDTLQELQDVTSLQRRVTQVAPLELRDQEVLGTDDWELHAEEGDPAAPFELDPTERTITPGYEGDLPACVGVARTKSRS